MERMFGVVVYVRCLLHVGQRTESLLGKGLLKAGHCDDGGKRKRLDCPNLDGASIVLYKRVPQS